MKFTYLKFKNLLTENYNNSPQEIKFNLESELNNWKGKYEQTDDICIIVIKL